MRIILKILITLIWSATHVTASEFFVFHPYSGTIEPSNPSVIASKHSADAEHSLTSAAKLFFDGPTNDAIQNGAFKPFKCSDDGVNLQDCGSSEILKSVSVIDNTAFVELRGVPAAATSGQWTCFFIPFSWTITQFEGIDDLKFVVEDVTFSTGGEGCSEMCFIMMDSAKEVKDWLRNFK